MASLNLKIRLLQLLRQYWLWLILVLSDVVVEGPTWAPYVSETLASSSPFPLSTLSPHLFTVARLAPRPHGPRWWGGRRVAGDDRRAPRLTTLLQLPLPKADMWGPCYLFAFENLKNPGLPSLLLWDAGTWGCIVCRTYTASLQRAFKTIPWHVWCVEIRLIC